MKTESLDIQEYFKRLNRIGIALSSERDLENLLGMILREARNFTRADAGALFLRHGDDLVFIVAQSETLENRIAEKKSDYVGATIPFSKESIGGFAAVTKQILNIPDVYRLPPDAEYKHYRKFDEEYNYRSKSILAVPLQDLAGEVIGVLELINSLNEKGEPAPFEKIHEELVHSLASQAAVSIKNAQLLDELKRAHLDTIFRLSVAAEYRDEDTDTHLRRVSSYSVIIAQELKLPQEEIDLLRYATPMHDIGKIGIPDAILLKPGKLTTEEFEEMKKHTLIGAKILDGSDLPLFKMAREIALTHHEKWNGSGYPRGLKGEEIPLIGRIVALPDVFDALTSKRVYKPPLDIEKTLAIIKQETGKHFDPMISGAFFHSLGRILKTLEMETKNSKK